MADVKVSGLPSDTSLDGNHYTILNDPTGPTTKRTLLSTLAAFFFNQVNIPDGSGSPRTRQTEIEFDFVASGCVWSGDAYASTRAASMTSGVVYINGRRLTMSAVVARVFTASKDTYIDILDNGDGTATLVYTEVANNAASPALAANSMRIGIIVTGASNIANSGSVNQGQTTMQLPVVSSNFLSVADTLGNLICPRDPRRILLGFRQTYTSFAGSAGTEVDVTGLNLVTALVPANRKVKVSAYALISSSAGGLNKCHIKEGATYLNSDQENLPTAGVIPVTPVRIVEPSTGLHTYKLTCFLNGTSSVFSDNTNWWCFVKVELE